MQYSKHIKYDVSIAKDPLLCYSVNTNASHLQIYFATMMSCSVKHKIILTLKVLSFQVFLFPFWQLLSEDALQAFTDSLSHSFAVYILEPKTIL